MSVLEEREANIQRKEAETTLRSRHPDFEDIRGDDKFHEWAKEQPEAIQGLSLIHISEPTRLGMISYAVFCLLPILIPFSIL